MITSSDLARVSGGGDAYDKFANAKLDKAMPAYRGIVCDGAGVEAGPKISSQMYKNSTDAESMVFADAITAGCNKISRLPSQAPATPWPRR